MRFRMLDTLHARGLEKALGCQTEEARARRRCLSQAACNNPKPTLQEVTQTYLMSTLIPRYHKPSNPRNLNPNLF